MDCSRLVLLELAGLGVDEGEPLSPTTVEVGRVLGVSQQTASRYLNELEEKGWISRERGDGKRIHITNQGLGILESMDATLTSFLAQEQVISLEWLVTSGLGEGAYYIRQYQETLMEKLGFKPYPGTLNVSVNRPPSLERLKGIRVIGFEREERSFGGLELYHACLHYEGGEVDCFLIVPERTHKRNHLEFVSDTNLRERFGLKDGDRVSVELH